MGQSMEGLKYLREFWFSHPDIWFGCGPDVDKMIINKFGHLLSQEISGDDLEHAILWDQIARHVYRTDSDKIESFHQKALQLSLRLLEQNYDQGLKSKERWFLLMPLRHTFDKSYLETVIKKVRSYIVKEGVYSYRRFYRATLLSYSKIVTQELEPESTNSEISNSDIVSILDEKSCKSIQLVSGNNEVTKTKIYKNFKTLIRNHPTEGIVVSISGGADSMTCSYVLYHLRIKYPDLKIVAVMVNYNNREECLVETELVARWLKSLDIPLYVRHVKYLKRKNEDDPTDRDFYEKVTKQFRFDMYRRFGYPVVLGHNKDDCIENIFTNIRKGRNYDNLKGMGEITVIDGITFYRPMLDFNKSEIYIFAKDYHIPYLIDSTPEWSDRGRIRDSLVPFLNKFDPALIPGLINLSNNISDLYSSQNMLVERFVKNIKITQTEAILAIDNDTPERGLGFSFWKQIVRYIVDSLDVGMCSNRSIHSFVKTIKYPRFIKINLSKYLEVIHNYNVIIFVAKKY